MIKSLTLLCLLPLSLAAQFASGTDQYITENGVKIQRDSLTYVSATDPGCTYVGRVWQNTSTTTTVNNICQNVSGVLTWVISGTGSLPASATVVATNSGGVGIAAPLPTGDIWFGTGNLPVASTLATAGIQPSSKGCTIVGSTTLANCVTQLTAGGGTITCPAGTTASIASTLILDNLSGITIEGINDAAGGLPACVILFTGATGPAISIKNSFGMRITGVAIEWNNASFTGDIINTDNGALNTNTSNLEIDHIYFAVSSGGVAVTNILNINNTINTNIHDNNFCGPGAVAILGANTASDFVANITVGPQNNFGCGAGTFSASFIRNIESANIANNTFEMSIGAGSPAVMDQTVAVISQGVSFGPGNWIGDTPSGYSGNFFNFTSGDVEGLKISGNTIAHRTNATGSIVNLGIPTFGFELSNNALCGPIILTSAANNTGVLVHGNNICGGVATGLNITSGNLNSVEWSGNGNGAPTTLVSGTPVTGYVITNAGVPTWYGSYATTRTLPIAFGDANNTIAISTGAVTYFKATYPCTITGWDITVDAGTITYDVWKIAAGTAIPTVANTITASALPALSTATALHSTTLTGWTTAIAAGDWIGYQVNTVSGAHNSTFQLECRQTSTQ